MRGLRALFAMAYHGERERLERERELRREGGKFLLAYVKAYHGM